MQMMVSTYDYEREQNLESGGVSWSATCHVKGYKSVNGGSFNTKSNAKKHAAYKMLLQVWG